MGRPQPGRPVVAQIMITVDSNNPETALDRVADAFGTTALMRLRALKTEVDPENVFRDNFSVALGGGPFLGTTTHDHVAAWMEVLDLLAGREQPGKLGDIRCCL